jgi:hypothetical protein
MANLRTWGQVSVLLLALCCGTTTADIIYVDPNGSADFTTIGHDKFSKYRLKEKILDSLK